MLLPLIKGLATHALPTMAVAASRRRSRRGCSTEGAPRILVTRLDGIGDVILLAPFLRELRRNYPDSAITLVVNQSFASIATACPYVNEVLLLEPWTNATTVTYLKYLIDFADRHISGSFDIAIQPR